jgi:DNA-binding transcriptional regulator YiaG
MDAVADKPADLDELRLKAGQVEDLVTPSRSSDEQKEARATRAERRLAWYQSVEDAVLDLSNAMPENLEDYDVRKLFEIVVELRRLVEANPDERDTTGEIELASMKAADIVKRIQRRLRHQRLDDPQTAAASIFKALDGIGASELATLLGVSTKTVGAWRHGAPVARNSRRIVIVAQLLDYLQSSMTPRGLMMWFDAERDQLGGRTPLDVLDENEAAAHPVLLSLAIGSRGQLAS